MLCYSTGSLPFGSTPEQILQWLLPTRFRGIEWVVTPSDLQRSSEASYWQGLRKTFESRGFQVTNIHLGFPLLLSPVPHKPGLTSLDPEARLRRRMAVLQAMGIAENLGSTFITVTSGLPEINGGAAADSFSNSLPSEIPLGARTPDFRLQCEVFRDELEYLVGAKPKTLKILIEQEPEMVIHRTSQVLGYCQTFEGEVFANLDVGHSAVIEEDIPGAILALGAYLKNVHLEDIAGQTHRHLLYGEGDIDFGALFNALRHIGYQGHLTPDLYPFAEHPGPSLVAAGEFLTQWGY